MYSNQPSGVVEHHADSLKRLSLRADLIDTKNVPLLSPCQTIDALKATGDKKPNSVSTIERRHSALTWNYAHPSVHR